MMKRMIMAVLAMAITLPAAFSSLAQDDDIYYKKASKKSIYKEASADEWSTDANDDWNLDEYNRRGKELDDAIDADLADAAFYYEIPDGNGGVTKVPGTKKDSLKVNLTTDYTKDIAPIHDTIFIVEQYAYCDRIRRFHNPYFGYYRYSPWYDIAYYDPFYWDYCYYDPWWYVTPSFGFHYGNWYWGWDFGYYTGWYGGWYCPYYHPYPHYYYPSYGYGGGWAGSTGGTGIRRGNGRRDGYHGSRSNSGGHFASRGGWRGNGGSTRGASAGNNRSYRSQHNTAATTHSTSLSGRNTGHGRLNPSNMTNRTHAVNTEPSRTSIRSNNVTTAASTHRGSADNSTIRRQSNGVRQSDRGTTIRHNDSGSHSSSSYNGGSYRNYDSTPVRSSSGSSSYGSSTPSRSSSSPSRSSSSSAPSRSSGGSFSSGGGGGRSSGGSSSSGGGRSGRR